MSVEQPNRDLPRGEGLNFALVAARFNSEWVDALAKRVRDCLLQAGSGVELIRVPGAWEIPLGTQIAARTSRFDAVVALAVVVAGDTRHHEHIAVATGWGIQEVSLKEHIPIINGILVTETEDQARARTLGEIDKGFHFALAALEMGRMIHTLPWPSPESL